MSAQEGRRRAPRLEFDPSTVVTLRSWASVQIVDISMTGVLLETTTMEPSDRLELLMPLGGAGFSVMVEVRRRELFRDARGECRVRIGGAFVDLDDTRQRQLAQFLTSGLGTSQSERG